MKEMTEHKEPEWTAENINRKQGDTTFKICGWCEWRGCGSCRYDCALETSCSLMPDYGLGREVFWDTDCLVVKLGQQDKKYLISHKDWEIETHKKSIKRLKKERAKIKKLSFTTKPCLPCYRPYDYYDVNEIVYVFHDNKWNRGITVNGYRHQDGCISYVLDDYPDSKKGWGCGVGVPCILKKWEYDYFRKNRDKFKTWLELSDVEYNGEKLPVDQYYEALIGR